MLASPRPNPSPERPHLGARAQMPYMVPYSGQGFMVLPNGAALPPQGLPHYMYSFPMPMPGAHQPAIGVIAAGAGAAP